MIVEWILSGFVGLIIGILLQDPLVKLYESIKNSIKRKYYTHKKGTNLTTSEFEFGDRKTSVIVIDGDGRKEYSKRNIQARLNNSNDIPSPYQQEIDYFLCKTNALFSKMAQNNQSIPWNGKTISLTEYSLSRVDTSEDMTLDLELVLNEYYTTYSVITNLDEVCPSTNRSFSQYISAFDFTEPKSRYELPNSIGVCIQVFTKDYKTIFTRRSFSSGFRPGEYDVSVVEGLNLSDAHNGHIDFSEVVKRGCCEELCELQDSELRVHLLGLFFDKKYNQWNIVGTVDLGISSEEIITRRNSGVDGKWELKSIDFINQDLKDIIVYLLTHKMWDMGVVTTYFALLYKLMCSRDQINKMIKKYSVSDKSD